MVERLSEFLLSGQLWLWMMVNCYVKWSTLILSLSMIYLSIWWSTYLMNLIDAWIFPHSVFGSISSHMISRSLDEFDHYLTSFSLEWWELDWLDWGNHPQMVISWNRGTPKPSIYRWDCPWETIHLGDPHLWKMPNASKLPQISIPDIDIQSLRYMSMCLRWDSELVSWNRATPKNHPATDEILHYIH